LWQAQPLGQVSPSSTTARAIAQLPVAAALSAYAYGIDKARSYGCKATSSLSICAKHMAYGCQQSISVAVLTPHMTRLPVVPLADLLMCFAAGILVSSETLAQACCCCS
jgi:hypothetical protein